MDKRDKYEVAKLVREHIDGTVEELKPMLSAIEEPPKYSDDKVKQAILDLSSAGYQKLISQFGERGVISLLAESSQGKRW